MTQLTIVSEHLGNSLDRKEHCKFKKNVKKQQNLSNNSGAFVFFSTNNHIH